VRRRLARLRASPAHVLGDRPGSLVFPILWLVFALTLQHLTDGFAMYTFLDVGDHGWPRVLFNAAVVAVLLLGLAAAAHILDRRLPGRRARV
jgi:hypothetical protein